jgi:hypothetical protein
MRNSKRPFAIPPIRPFAIPADSQEVPNSHKYANSPFVIPSKVEECTQAYKMIDSLAPDPIGFRSEGDKRRFCTTRLYRFPQGKSLRYGLRERNTVESSCLATPGRNYKLLPALATKCHRAFRLTRRAPLVRFLPRFLAAKSVIIILYSFS